MGLISSYLDRLTDEELRVGGALLPGLKLFSPDVTIAPDGDPYLFRWHIVYNNDFGNVFLHLQIKSDPERPLHDHPWDNMSVILSGGYDELWEPHAPNARWASERTSLVRKLRKGQSVYRRAEEAHRLILPPDIPYALTLFTTGPRRRAWGFWYPDGFHDAKRHVDNRADGTSVHVHEGES